MLSNQKFGNHSNVDGAFLFDNPGLARLYVNIFQDN